MRFYCGCLYSSVLLPSSSSGIIYNIMMAKACCVDENFVGMCVCVCVYVCVCVCVDCLLGSLASSGSSPS